jgi:hypothetical protein
MRTTISHEFVDSIPEHLDDGTVYISIPYAIAVHRCCCGCGHEVITPLHPLQWSLTYNGETISLHPSIGNWSFSCRSHYWIRNDNIHTARTFTNDEITDLRTHDREQLTSHYTSLATEPDTDPAAASNTLMSRLVAWISRTFRRSD